MIDRNGNEVRQFSVLEICRIFDVPPWLIDPRFPVPFWRRVRTLVRSWL